MEKQQIFFIHGAESFSHYEAFLDNLRIKPIYDLPSAEPSQRWTHTLRSDLGTDYEVFMPSMPNKQNARYLEWKIWFERHFEYLRDGCVLIGWSQGGYFLAKYLTEERLPFTVKALVLMAAPFAPDDFGGEDGGDFAFDTSRVGKIEEKVERVYILHSTDDPVVPVAHAERYQKALPSATILLHNDKNHFLVPEFPELIEMLRGL